MTISSVVCRCQTRWTVNHVVDFTNGLEHCKVVIKADQEHATNGLTNQVFETRQNPTVPKECARWRLRCTSAWESEHTQDT